MAIGIIGAMDKEIEGLKSKMCNIESKTISGITFYTGSISGSEVIVAASGIGKVSAAICTQTMTLVFKPSAIICCGVAGALSNSLHIGNIAVADKVVQHDLDTSPVGDPLGYISALDTVELSCNNSIVIALQKAAAIIGVTFETGTIASGDQFICSDLQRSRIKSHFNPIAVEMEGAAIGQVCSMNGIPFGIVRAISDGAGDDSHISYDEFAVLAAQHSVEIITQFLLEYKEI
ncbi:MAG: 5'-methylthioadenosine/adenosylhomocysteine nucleosidase [Bacillota bacterium]|nr:5'-methylthioadenosine/adenosylhomocysteine nucleosidase [Bacillota bacterium]